MIIRKKTWPEYFQKLLEGNKKFDARIADFEARAGDTIIFEEYDPTLCKYTGRVLQKKITFVAKTKDWTFFKKEDIEKYGYIIMSITDK